MTSESGSLARFLSRPIVFQEPDRAVDPPSWLEHVPFAFWIVDSLRPSTLVELGTHSGNSYAGFAQAVQRLGLPTACYAVDTWRGDAHAGFYDERVFAEWSAYHDRHFAAFSSLIRSTFADAAAHFPLGSVDLLHSDGCHTYEAVCADLELWLPRLSRRGVLLLHDINVREGEFGVWRRWEELKAQFPSFEFLHGHGLGVLGVGADLPEPVRWLFSIAADAPGDVSAVRQFFARLGAAVSARYSVDASRQEWQREELTASANLQTQLARERDQQEEELRTKWQLAAELQDCVREEHQQRLQLEAFVSEQHRRFEEERQRRDADEAARLASLEQDRARQAAEHEDALRRKTVLIGELQDRLRHEIERQALEAEQNMGRTPRRDGARDPSGWLHVVRAVRNIVGVSAALGLKPTFRHPIRPAAVWFLRRPEKIREAQAVLATGLFDPAHYRGRYPDVAAGRLTPLAHFVLIGAREGRAPHPLFDSAYYLQSNPDVAASQANPLVHYHAQGAFEGRLPHPLFDTAYYLSMNPDVRDAGKEPLLHFLTAGAREGRDPNLLFDSSFYLERYPDVERSGTNPLLHYMEDGWREGRQPSPSFDTEYYLSNGPDVRAAGVNPLEHYFRSGRAEGRLPAAGGEPAVVPPVPISTPPQIKLAVRPLAPSRREQPTVLCLSHVMPLPPRAGNEYRIYRLLQWLRSRGYRIVPLVAPLPGERVESGAVEALAAEFSNAVLCDRSGRVEYILRDVPDVLGQLGGDLTRPIATLLGEDTLRDHHGRELLDMDRAFCHDTLITAALRLHQVLGSYVLLNEYIWMSRILPLVTGDVLKVIDTIDVFSTKRQKVLRFGIDDIHVEPREEAKRLRGADLLVAIQDEERQQLEQLVPGKRVVTAGVDFDVVRHPGVPSGRRVLCIGSDNPMNKKGLGDFLRFAWPHVRRQVPDAELLVAGKVSRDMNLVAPGVTCLGPVDDLGPLYSQSRVVINPAVAGTGLKIKTLEALGHLRPIVTWPNGADGLPKELAALCNTVEDWYEYARRLASMLAADDPILFTPAQRASIERLTSSDNVYRALTAELDAFTGRHADNRIAKAAAGV